MAYLNNIMEQTTWTPTIDGAVSGTTTYTTQAGNYTWIGNIIIANFKIVITAATGTGNVQIGGFPYALTAGGTITVGNCIFNGSSWSFPTSRTIVRLAMTPGNNFCLVRGCSSSVGIGTFQMTNAALTVQGQITYFKS